MNDLSTWWAKTTENELQPMLNKIKEYGGDGMAIDLLDIGNQLARLSKREVTEAEAAELGCYFYILGKLARWSAAITENRQVSDDTLHDIGIYVRMVQRIRDCGEWPGKL